MIRTTAVLLASLLLWPWDSTIQAQGDQRSIAAQLLSEDAHKRSSALEAALEIGLQNAHPELRVALITALEREGALHRQHYFAEHNGEFSPPLEDPELLARLSRAVADLKDPASIPALAAALGSGFTVIRALAGFGERAAPSVLSVVASPESMPDAVNDGLITLRFMVEGAPARPLRGVTVKQIRRVAAQRLSTGKGLAVTTLWWAIDLAAVLNDATLRRSIELLATDWNEPAKRGISDPELIAQTQKRAANRLAGLPPLPRP
jgi:hypothetical protein